MYVLLLRDLFLEINTYESRRADLDMFNMFGETGAAQKGASTGQKMSYNSDTIFGLWGHFMACCDKMQHNIFLFGEIYTPICKI